MTQDEIIEMARQAGMAYEDKLEVYVANIDDLQDFAKLVAEKEREDIIDLVAMYGGPVDLEAAIRARGEV
jgi:predicted protein tyrosine phosphatase